MKCGLGCGACYIAPSISSLIPGMPKGKPAGTRCVQLFDNNLCMLFEQPERPLVCSQFSASIDVCGKNKDEALWLISSLENQTLIGY